MILAGVAPPSKNTIVALDLEEPEDWILRLLVAQILNPINHIMIILSDGN